MDVLGGLSTDSVGFSRILRHLDGSFAVISAFIYTSEKKNLLRHKGLIKDVLGHNYGFIELESTWREEGEEDSREMSLFVPGMGLDLALSLGVKYGQHSILSKEDGGGVEWVCTDRLKCGRVGSVIESFSGRNISRDDFVGAFSKLRKGSHGARNTRFQFSVRVRDRNSVLPVAGFGRYSYFDI